MAWAAGRTEEHDLLTLSIKAGATVNQYRILKKGSNADEVIQTTAATDFPVGVAGIGSMENAGTYDSGDMVDVKTFGVAYVKMSGTGNQDDRVVAGANGYGYKHVAADGVYVLGHATQAWADGDIIPVLINRYFLSNPEQS